MPKATLLGTPGKTHLFMHGQGDYYFLAGVPQVVPVTVALLLKRQATRKGQQRFRIEDMPEVITSAPLEVVVAQKLVEQNVSLTPRQTRFESWPLS